jgi:hypothetical protein
MGERWFYFHFGTSTEKPTEDTIAVLIQDGSGVGYNDPNRQWLLLESGRLNYVANHSGDLFLARAAIQDAHI